VSSNRSRAQRTRAEQTRVPRPLPTGNTLFTPGASPGRQALEHRSATALLWLHQLSPWVPAVLAAGLLVAGLALGGVGGAIALCGVAAVLGWLTAISWPRLSAQGRLLRVAAICCVLAVAIIRGLHG
jgi:hypothetical protein